MSNICAICENEVNFLTRRKIANNESICSDCFNKAKTLTPKQILKLKNVTADEIKQSIIESDPRGSEYLNFKASKTIGDIEFDDEQGKILIPGPYDSYNIINYNDIVNFELLEDGQSVASGGLGRALAGGLLFGGTGAIVGAVTGKKKNKEYCNSLNIKVTVRNSGSAAQYIPFISNKTKTSSNLYKTSYRLAQECLSTLQLICDQQENDSSEKTSVGAEEILKYKELLDAGAITKDEYEAKKKQLLGL